jgi:hypothetical protein
MSFCSSLQGIAVMAYNLALLKGLLHLLQVGQVANIRADALGCSTQGANRVGNAEVDFPCVGLSGNGVGRGEAGFLAENL